MRFPDGVQLGDPWVPTAECKICGERFNLKREQMFLPDGRSTDWYLLELIAYLNLDMRSSAA